MPEKSGSLRVDVGGLPCRELSEGNWNPCAIVAGGSVLMEELAPMAGKAGFALSYQAENLVAAALYARLGFVETGEVADDEVVARLRQA